MSAIRKARRTRTKRLELEPVHPRQKKSKEKSEETANDTQNNPPKYKTSTQKIMAETVADDTGNTWTISNENYSRLLRESNLLRSCVKIIMNCLNSEEQWNECGTSFGIHGIVCHEEDDPQLIYGPNSRLFKSMFKFWKPKYQISEDNVFSGGKIKTGNGLWLPKHKCESFEKNKIYTEEEAKALDIWLHDDDVEKMIEVATE